MSIKKSSKEAFSRAKKIMEVAPELSNKEVGQIVGRHANTISKYKKFDTYKEYSDYNKERLAEYQEQQEEEEQKPLSKKEKDEKWFETMLEETQQQTEMLETVISLLEEIAESTNLESKIL